MIPVAALLITASTFWAGAAPGIAQQNCPDGVRYNVKPISQMGNHANPDRDSVQAEAPQTIYVYPDGRRVVKGHCLITFRAGWRQFATDRQACRIAVHEMGHAALGLEHSDGGVMTPSESGTTPGICFRYSNSQKTVGKPTNVYWS